jgi:fibronectin-binding autotransporter adhesin
MLFHSVKPDRRAYRRVRALSICLGLCLAAVGHAAVTIDPDAVGATDVTPYPVQPSIDLTIGGAATGALRIDAGSKITNTFGRIGRDAGSTGEATVTGAGSTWNNQAALYVGDGGDGALTIEAGGSVNNHAGWIGYQAGSIGEATVSGVGSAWVSRSNTVVGDRGAGTLTVRDGGQVSTDTEGRIGNQTDSTGAATVAGAGSRWDLDNFYIGNSGDGALRIENGGAVDSLSGLLGAELGSSGVATVSGAGSLWNLRPLSSMNVGMRGDGALRIEAGGEVRNLTGSIGIFAGSKGVATVTGAGSKWNNAENLRVGNAGDGTLRVEDGGAVVSRSTYIGAYAGGMGEAVVTGALSKWTLDQLSVGRSGSGKLRVEAGGLVDVDSAGIGALAGSMGEALVTGAGSRWTVAELLQVSAQSDGVLRVEAGGVVTSRAGGIGYSPGATGVATVTGAGSQWNNSADVQVGVWGNTEGTLRIEAGGLLANKSGTLGSGAGSVGAATVTGAGSQWRNTGPFYAGLSGDGTLLIENGGVVTCNSFSHVARNAGSTGAATVTGAGSQWNSAGTLFIGSYGAGTLRVDEGGVVTSSSGFIAQDSESSGAVTITGAGSRWTNTTQLGVGGGTLRVEAGGVVVSQIGFVGTSFDVTGAATVTGAGSQWNNSSDLYVGGTPIGARYGATLDILDQGNVSVAGTTKLWAEGSVTLDNGGVLRTESLDITVGAFGMHSGGRLEADAVVGDLVNLSGVVAPHVGVGVMTISGDYDQAANATLEIELGGVDADQFDAIAIAGEATLNGTLEVALLNSFTPAAGDLFTVLDSGVVSGAFATVDFTAASLPAGLEWRVDYYADRVDLQVIEAAPALAGDYNSDGVVNAADYTVWRDGNSPDSSRAGYDLWVDNYGATTATATFNTAPQAVPEPASAIALLLAGLGLMVRRSAAVETSSRPR